MAFLKKELTMVRPDINNYRLLSNDDGAIRIRMTRAAEVNNSPRIGKLDLYEEPEDVIKHYKDAGFDIVDAMNKVKGNCLWVRARAIDADVANENGDYFSWEEVIKEKETQSDRNKKKVPAYKTFEGVPIYANHENSDITKAKGKVVFAELDEEERCVYCTYYVDADAYPEIAKNIQLGIITDVSMGCFPVGELVMTSNGYRPIEEIQPNEILVDGEGNLTKIRNKQEVNYSGPLTEIEIEGGPVIRCTPNHPLFKIKKQDECLCGCGEKIEEIKNKKKSLQKRFKRGHHQNIYNSMVVYASEDVDKINAIRNLRGKTEIEAIEAGDLEIGDYLVSPIGGEVIDSKIPNELARLIGYFIAEGCSSYDKNNNLSRVEFCFSLNEKETLAKETIEIIQNNFNITPYIQIREDRNNCVVHTSNKEVMEFLVNNCGRYSHGKKINNDLLFESDEFQKNLIGAWLSGDGYLRILPNDQEPSTIHGWTISQELVEQMSFMLNRLGIYHTIHTVIDGKYNKIDIARTYPKDFKGINNQRISYCINIPSTYSRDIYDYCNFKKNNVRFSSHKGHRNTEKYLMRKISNISTVDYDGPVYNFEVESDDHTYLVDGIKVSNCQVEFSYCSICGNKAEKEAEWCNCLKTRKGKKFSGVIDKGKRKGQKVQNELVYEDNHDLKFIELSVVSDGAFANCSNEVILPYSEVLTFANQLKCTASNMKEIVAQNVQGLMQKRATSSNLELIDYLGSSQDILNKIENFSSSIISNLSMQKTASMNKEAYMNVLDTLNDVLNKIEAVIISLLGRKDNIDLSHVAKISKSMSDLQQVISDLIDDGVGTLSDAVNFQSGGQQPQMEGQAPAQDYATGNNNVGRVMGMEQGVMQTQPAANIIEGGDNMSAVPFQFTPTLEPPGFQQQLAADVSSKWQKFAKDLGKVNIKLDSVIDNLEIKSIIEPKEIQGGISVMNKQLNERVANALMNKIATVVEQPIIASREDGKFKVVISDKDGEEITGYVNNEKTEWQPSSLTMEDIDSIRENRVASVTHKLMDDFVGFVKEAAWKPETPGPITREQQLAPYRKGNPEDVQEVQISEKRTGNPEDVQEVQVSEKRTGAPEDKTEHRLQEDSATVWGRKDNSSDVQEEQLSGVRKGIDVEVWEHKLQSRRSSTPESKVATASLNALACVICDSGASPTEVLDITKESLENAEFTKIIASYFATDAYKARIAKRERVDLGLDEATYKDIPTAFFERIADVLVDDEGVAPQDIKIALSSIIAAPKEGMKKLLGKFVREQAHNVRLASSGERSRDDLIKGAVYAAMSDAYDEPLDRSHLKVALFAIAETAAETKVTPDEIFEIIGNINDYQNALVTLETERLPNAMAARIRDKERDAFWGRNASSDSTPNIEKILFASLADYAEAMESSENRELPSHLIWQVAKKIANGGENSRILVNAAIEARNEKPTLIKDAASLTDRTDTVREIRLSMDEIPNSDPSSDEFAETVRDYAIAFLQNKGYRVDPETFNFTRLTVNDGAREIIAIVQSSIVKEFDDEEFSMPENGMMEEIPTEEPLFTPMALQQRKNKREALLREAQAAPMGGGAGGGGAAPMDSAPMGSTPEPPGGGPGLSSLLGGDPNAGAGEPDEDSNLDNASNPGQIKPIGSICPACGSTNVDLAASKGECSDCHTKFDLQVSLDNIVTPDENAALPEGEGGLEEAVGPEGLGAALAPPGPEATAGPEAAGGAAPPPSPMGGGMPMAASVSWYATPEQFVRLAKKKSDGLTDEQIAGPKPPGTVCIACGNKQVRRAKSQYFCDHCGTIGKIEVGDTKYDDRVLCKVSYLLPPLDE